jgi:hypothetical protein
MQSSFWRRSFKRQYYWVAEGIASCRSETAWGWRTVDMGLDGHGTVLAAKGSGSERRANTNARTGQGKETKLSPRSRIGAIFVVFLLCSVSVIAITAHVRSEVGARLAVCDTQTQPWCRQPSTHR